MKSLNMLMAVMAMVFVSVAWSSVAMAQEMPCPEGDILLTDIPYGGGVVDVCINVLYEKNPHGHCPTVLGIHGLSESGYNWIPFADEQASMPHGPCRFLAINMPGRGGSGFPRNLPAGVQFGNLGIAANAALIDGVLAELKEMWMTPRTIYAHSMGGITAITLQQQLMDRGTSLRREYGVSKLVLLSPVPPRGTPWTRYPGGDLAQFIKEDVIVGGVNQGRLFIVPLDLCGQIGAFTLLDGSLVEDYPTPEVCQANQWGGWEPAQVAIELSGLYCFPDPDALDSGPYCRPGVNQGIFYPWYGTTVIMVTAEGDVLTPSPDGPGTYEYLTGIPADSFRSKYRMIEGEAVPHSIYMLDPWLTVWTIFDAMYGFNPFLGGSFPGPGKCPFSFLFPGPMSSL